MQEIFKTYEHNPPHHFKENSYYFLTGGTYLKKPYFNTDDKKKILFTVITKFMEIYEAKLVCYSIMNNHYHIIFLIKNAHEIPEMVRKIHSKSAVLLKKQWSLDKHSNKIWYNYWDTTIRNERMLYQFVNYVIYNPLKHGYVKDITDYEFTSYHWYKENRNTDILNDAEGLELFGSDDF